MIRIVCPGCHSPLSSAELEQATIDGHLSLVCPECAMVLLTEPVDAHLIQKAEEAPAHV
jgi:RNase P subunit RPR2